MVTRRWHLQPPLPERLGARFAAAGVHPLLAQLLYNRGFTAPQAAQAFLRAGVALVHDPFLLPDMDRAVARVRRAIAEREPIAVYGDFDADGITATALLVTGLRRLGGVARPYIPHREAEGYGLNRPALDALHAEGIGLVITVDTGTSAPDEVAHARALGVETIVTDHHSIPEQLPQAVALLNPHRQDTAAPYPFPHLTGAGVAYKLLGAVARSLGRDLDEDDYLDLVAIGTVADLGPLLGENRYFVRHGLRLLNTPAAGPGPGPRRLGLQALFRRAGLKPGTLTARDIGFMIAPRLNAAGRLDHASLSYRLLTTEDPEEAYRLADTLEALNRERQLRTEDALARARELVGDGADLPLVLVGDASFGAGIVGLVAGKLAEEWYRPAVALAVGPELSQGSARSIPGFNIVQAVRECQDLLERCGGHAQAAGFTVRTERLPALRERLLDVAARTLAGQEPVPVLEVDAAVAPDALPGAAALALHELEPHGLDNPEPLFLGRGLALADHRAVGAEGKHLQLKLRDARAVWRAVGFHLAGQADQLAPRLDVVYTLEVDGWAGRGTLRLNVKDFRPTQD
ncbi:MAG: single-stranded-DNA-specific exonuclease RecJ [Chloroflexi bacterium]|nr:single-stranded-DNA-specific exonuclease RecJ [Chloroflexota bacterium]